MNTSRRTFTQLLVAGAFAVALPCSSLAALLTDLGDASPNLLQNGDFSKGTEGWTFNAHNKQGKVGADASVTHDGKPSVRIDNVTADDSHLSQVVAVKPGTRYRLTGWIKTDKIKPGPANPKSTSGASLGVRATFLISESLNKTHEWKRVTLDVGSLDKKEIDIGPRLGTFGGTVIGTAWFADLSLKELGPAKR